MAGTCFGRSSEHSATAGGGNYKSASLSQNNMTTKKSWIRTEPEQILLIIALIPPHMLLAIGDHRGSSLDGRYFGLVDENDVYGKALGVYRRRGEGFIWKPL